MTTYKNAIIISPESIDLNFQYAITFNPSDDYQYWTNKDYNDRIRALNAYMTIYVLKVIPAECHLRMEFSRTGRLHYHGTIQFHSLEGIRVFYLEVLHKLQLKFQIEIDTIKDIHVWANYCTKMDKLICEELSTNCTQLRRYNKLNKNIQSDVTVACQTASANASRLKAPASPCPEEEPINKNYMA